MKLKNVKVGMKVMVKDDCLYSVSNYIRGTVLTVTETDRIKKYESFFEVEVINSNGDTEILDASNIRKLKKGER